MVERNAWVEVLGSGGELLQKLVKLWVLKRTRQPKAILISGIDGGSVWIERSYPQCALIPLVQDELWWTNGGTMVRMDRGWNWQAKSKIAASIHKHGEMRTTTWRE